MRQVSSTALDSKKPLIAITVLRAALGIFVNYTRNARVLRPIAGDFAHPFFAADIIGTGLLAVPILAGSAAYAVAETFKLCKGLYPKLRQAPGYCSVIAFSALLGFAIDQIGINPIQALYYTAVLDGIVAPPQLVMIMRIGNATAAKYQPQLRIKAGDVFKREQTAFLAFAADIAVPRD